MTIGDLSARQCQSSARQYVPPGLALPFQLFPQLVVRRLDRVRQRCCNLRWLFAPALVGRSDGLFHSILVGLIRCRAEGADGLRVRGVHHRRIASARSQSSRIASLTLDRQADRRRTRQLAGHRQQCSQPAGHQWRASIDIFDHRHCRISPRFRSSYPLAISTPPHAKISAARQRVQGCRVVILPKNRRPLGSAWCMAAPHSV